MEENFKIWEPNEMIRKEYEKDNYYIKNIKNDTNKCLIFFSGHGIYYPNTKEEFIKKIIINNYYEWEKIAESEIIKNNFNKIVFIRDLYKQWYVTGMSEKYSSISSMLDKLKKITQGYEIVTAGNSAGGYTASIFAVLLGAEKCINISGQFSVWDRVEKESFLNKYQNEGEKNQYYDITKLLENSKTDIFYFYPSLSLWDRKQADMVRTMNNVYLYPFRSKIHGKTMLSNNIPIIIAMDNKKLIEIYHKFGRGGGKIKFLFCSAGLKRGSVMLLNYCIKPFIKKVKFCRK